MRLLLIHQNFPGQFRQLAPHLEQRGHELVAVASHQRPIALKGRVLRYEEPARLTGVPWAARSGMRVLSVLLVWRTSPSSWKRKDGAELILAHTGWGETLGLQGGLAYRAPNTLA